MTSLSSRAPVTFLACWVTQAPCGCSVTPVIHTRRRPSSMKKSTSNRLSVSVSTVKKSVATIWDAFVTEWFATLQILRDIAGTISRDENRPRWLPSDVPMGAQADQFLHAYYYNQVIGDDGRSLYEEKFATN